MELPHFTGWCPFICILLKLTGKLIISHQTTWQITSANATSGYKQHDNIICHKNIYKLTYHLSTINQKLLLKKYPNYIIRITFHIHHQMWMSWESITFSHTPEEAMSAGLAKACVLWKNWICSREIEFFIEKLNRMRSLHSFIMLHILPYMKITPLCAWMCIYFYVLIVHKSTWFCTSLGNSAITICVHVYIYRGSAL